MTPEPCRCPGPGLCPVFGREMSAFDQGVCSGTVLVGGKPVAQLVRLVYRRRWTRGGPARGRDRPKPVRLPTLAEVPCPYRGALISECSGCGGKKPERHTYQCLCDEAEADLCVPVPKKDVEWPADGIRACHRCPFRPGAGGPAPGPSSGSKI